LSRFRLHARLRIVRLRGTRAKRRVIARSLATAYNVENHLYRYTFNLRTKFRTYFATISGLVIGTIFALTTSDEFIVSTVFSSGGFHVACAEVIGAAVALVLSLSIIPAQRAADVFSTAILRLYARDIVLWRVFAILAFLTVFSMLLGTGWTIGLNPRWTIALQLILLGVALDALRGFYLRALDLLVPQTALGLVSNECARLIGLMAKHARRVTRVLQLAGGQHGAHRLPRPNGWHSKAHPLLCSCWAG
jgi:hypothetical protein